jgi:hypothetical protein
MVLKHLTELRQLLVDKPTRRLVLAAAQATTTLGLMLHARLYRINTCGDREAIINCAQNKMA